MSRWLVHCFEQAHGAVCVRHSGHDMVESFTKQDPWHLGIEQVYPFRVVLWRTNGMTYKGVSFMDVYEMMKRDDDGNAQGMRQVQETMEPGGHDGLSERE